VIRDLDLAAHGLKVVERRALNFLPTEDGRYLLTGEGRTKAEIAKFSAKDVANYDAYGEELDAITDVLRDLVLQQPPNLVQGWNARSFREALRLAFVGKRLRKLDTERQRALLDLFAKSAAEYLDRFFESDPIKAVLGFDAVVGNYASPYTPTSAYVLLHHCFGEVNGKKGIWGHAIGGMGAITQAMAKSARAQGVDIETDAGVREVIIEKGRATGVVLDDGRAIRARAVVSNLNPRLLYDKLIPDTALPPAFLARMKHWKCGSGTFRMNVALSELPSFTALPGRELADHHTAGIILAPTLAYMDRAYDDARKFGWSREPIVEMLIPSTLDDSLAPKGQHVASLFCQHVAPQLPDGSSWDDHRDTVADLMIATVDKYAPGFKQSVIARKALTPLDLERDFGLIGGDIFHGAMSLDQIFSARPMLGYADYRSPRRRALSVRLRHPSRRRRHRRARPQCSEGGCGRFEAADLAILAAALSAFRHPRAHMRVGDIVDLLHHDLLQLRSIVDVAVVEPGVAGQIDVAELAGEARGLDRRAAETVILIEVSRTAAH
jgi:phytoene dehydrogenase-like protein